MSIMNKISEALAANPGVSWDDLVMRQLRAAFPGASGNKTDLWMRWLAGQGYTTGSIDDRWKRYWDANNVPSNERNSFYMGYKAFFSVTVPGAPTIGTATAGNAEASVTFTAPASNGGSAITGYRATSTPGGFTATGAGSPLTVTGLSNGTGYTFTVAAQNAIGYGPESAASNSVTPANTDPNFANVITLLKMDNGNGSTTFTDNASSPKTYTARSTAAQSTSQIKFGASSLGLNGTSDYIDTASGSGILFGTGDFTFECWIYPTSIAGFRAILTGPNSTGTLQIGLDNTGKPYIGRYVVATDLTAASAVSLNQWTHLAFCKASGTMRIFINGVLSNAVGGTGGFSYDATAAAYIGSAGGTQFFFSGFIDDIRATAMARYTTGFTPPGSLPTS